MPEKRQHRGPHPGDLRLFDAQHWLRLRHAVAELSWLLSRDYAEASALKLVGDRHNLTARQRVAVRRCSCADAARADRQRRQVSAATIAGQPVRIDGFNLITTIEAALAGGVVLVGRDGCMRDMASMHGNYRKVQETRPAVALIGQALTQLQVARALWMLDRPVSNSGRLKTILLEMAAQQGWAWQVEVVPNPDTVLITDGAPVVSADGQVLDRCGCWLNLAAMVVEQHVTRARLVDLSADQ